MRRFPMRLFPLRLVTSFVDGEYYEEIRAAAVWAATLRHWTFWADVASVPLGALLFQHDRAVREPACQLHLPWFSP